MGVVSDLILPVTPDTLIYAGKVLPVYMIYMFLSYKYLPGINTKGFQNPKGEVLSYHLPGLALFIQTTVLYLVSFKALDISLIPLLSHFWSFLIVATIFSFIFSLYLFINGRASKEYSPHPQSWTPTWLNDFWFGPTLNPRLFGVDLKMFFYQPSLIGFNLMIFAFGEYQYRTYGFLTWNMILYQIFWWSYLLSHYWREDFMLTTWDIIAENFGFMLVWGDMTYLPFLYGIGGWIISDLPESINGLEIYVVVALHFTFHYMLRSTNWQKFDFKLFGLKAKIWGSEPKLLDGKLLVSGWWGIGRHLNYTGEILTYYTIAYCCGTGSILPFIVPLQLTCMLSHRAYRDDKRCHAKYGKLWEEYCSKVKFRMVPFLY